MLEKLVTAFVGGFWLSIFIVGLKTIRKSIRYKLSGAYFGLGTLLATLGGFGAVGCAARLYIVICTRTAHEEDQILSRQFLPEEKVTLVEHYLTKSNGVCVNNIQSLKTNDVVNLNIRSFRGRKIVCEITGVRKP